MKTKIFSRQVCILQFKSADFERSKVINMDNNNMYGQGNQNVDQEQPQQQPYQQQVPEQNSSQQYNQPYQQSQQQYNQPYQQSQQQYNQPYQQSQQQYSQLYQQQPYQKQPYQTDSDLEEPVSFGDWMLSILLTMIPCINIIMIFVWAFGSGVKKSKSNYFKAVLVWTLIWTVLMIVMMIGLGAMMAAVSESFY